MQQTGCQLPLNPKEEEEEEEESTAKSKHRSKSENELQCLIILRFKIISLTSFKQHMDSIQIFSAI